MSDFAILAATASVFGYGLVSGRRGWPLTAPLVALAAGAAFDGAFGSAADVAAGLQKVASLTLAVVIFADAARVDLVALRRDAGIPGRLLGIGMPLSLVAGTFAAKAIFPEFGWFEAVLLAAMVVPTDAALGEATVSDHRVPCRVRQGLAVESGLNDGIASPLFTVLAALVCGAAADGEARHGFAEWAEFVGAQLVFGPVAGLAVAAAAVAAISAARRAEAIEEDYERIAGVLIPLAAFLAAETVEGNGYLATFAAGLYVGMRSRSVAASLFRFGGAEGKLLTLATFVTFGAAFAVPAVRDASPRVWLAAAVALTVVRVVPVSIALAGYGLRRQTVAFIAWFGPRGLATLIFAILLAGHAGNSVARDTIVAVAGLTIVLSVVLHGVTAGLFVGPYAASLKEDIERESGDLGETPVWIPMTGEASGRSATQKS